VEGDSVVDGGVKVQTPIRLRHYAWQQPYAGRWFG